MNRRLHAQVPKRMRELVATHARRHGWDGAGGFVGAAKYLDAHDLAMLPASMPCRPPNGMNIEFWLTPTQRAIHAQRNRERGPAQTVAECTANVARKEAAMLVSLASVGLLVGFPPSAEAVAKRKEHEMQQKLNAARAHSTRIKAPAFRRAECRHV